VLAVEHGQVAGRRVEARDPAVLVVVAGAPVGAVAVEGALCFAGVEFDAFFLAVLGYVVGARKLVQVYLNGGVARQVLHVQREAARRDPHLGARLQGLSPAVERHVVGHHRGLGGVRPRAEGKRGEAPGRVQLKLVDTLILRVDGRRRVVGLLVVLPIRLGDLLFVLLLVERLEEGRLLLVQKFLLRGRRRVCGRAPRAQVRDLAHEAGGEGEGEEVVVPREDHALAVRREAGSGLLGPRVGEARLLVVLPVVEVEVAVGGVHLALLVGGVDVFAVVPAVERGRVGAALRGRHLRGLAAGARHLVERIALELAVRVPVDVERLPAFVPAGVVRPVADPGFGLLHDLLHREGGRALGGLGRRRGRVQEGKKEGEEGEQARHAGAVQVQKTVGHPATYGCAPPMSIPRFTGAFPLA
jgi:hypothetical protein